MMEITDIDIVKQFYAEQEVLDRPAVSPDLSDLPQTAPHADPKSSAKARGRRLKTLRMMMGFTRQALEQKYDISASTIQAWEAAKAGGLTGRGATRMLAIFSQEGITCTAEWLMHEIGAGPRHGHLPALIPDQEMPAADLLEKHAITQELLVFRTLHSGAVDLIVPDDGMGPKFRAGDCVAGVCQTEEKKIARIVGLDCIVQTTTGETLFRRVKLSAQQGLYNLVCTNPATTVIETTLYNQALVSAAPVIWHRRTGDIRRKVESTASSRKKK